MKRLAILLLLSCGDGPDLIGPRIPTAHSHEPGCGHTLPPDAGVTDARVCPDAEYGLVHPECALSPFP